MKEINAKNQFYNPKINRKLLIEKMEKITITKRIKTFKDAFDLYNGHIVYFECPESKTEISINAYIKLSIISEVLNEGWYPNWDNPNEYKYYPYFTGGSGFRFCDANVTYSDTFAYVGSRLCFRTRELAEYAGRQFVDIYRYL